MAAEIQPVAIVTGAGSGIGRATAIALAGAGMSVALVGRREEALEQTVEMMPGGAETLCVGLDVSDPCSGEEMVASCVARFGRLDVLVNNAGVAPLLAIGATDAATIQNVYMTNAVGPACAIGAAWRVFERQHRQGKVGRPSPCVVNVSTLGTADPFPGFFAYAGSKGSLNVMAQSCANEGKAIGVRAFAVAPGAVETAMLRAIFSEEVLPGAKCLTARRVAEEILACVVGERDEQNGKTIFMRAE